MDAYTPAENRLAQFLRGLAWFFLILYIAGAVGAYQGATTTLFIEPPFVSNAVASLGLLMILAWFAAGDVRRFRVMIQLLLTGLVFSILSFLLLAFGPKGEAGRNGLLAGIVLAAFLALILWSLLQQTPAEKPRWMPWMPDKPPTDWERWGRNICLAIGVGSLAAVAAHFALFYVGPPALIDFFRQPIMVGASAVKIGLLGLCLIFAARDLRRNGDLINMFILGNGLSFLIVLITHLGINRYGVVDYPALGTNSRNMMLGAVAVDITAILAFIALKLQIDRSLIDHTRFFSPIEFRALEAVAETLIDGGGEEKAEPEQIVLRTDNYLSSFPSSRLWLAKLSVLGMASIPMLTFRPPINYLSPQGRRAFIDKHFKQEIVHKRGIYRLMHWLRFDFGVDLVEAMMRFNMQLTYLGYYSNPDTQKDIGYTPFTQRPEGQNVTPLRHSLPPLDVMPPQMFRERGIDTLTADVVIIGSGAAGSILAEQMVAKGHDVLLLEKGPYIHPDDFTEDEVQMISQLYADGALQISQTLRFTVLQGSCIGGTTVVNNAVCFNTPEEVLDLWNDSSGLNAGIDETLFYHHQNEVRKRLHIRSLKDSSGTRPWDSVMNPGDRVVIPGMDEFVKQQRNGWAYGVVDANITDCLGCGYCNIGCKYGRKLSMLDVVLPKIQQDHPGKLRIVSEAQAVKLDGQGGTVTEIVAQLRDGRRLTIKKPNKVIVSAGAIASPWLLMRSGIGQGELPVGKYICFNMGSPLHGLWDEALNSYAGVQIAHYLKPPGKAGYVYETWYNPPVAQALTMPGWLDTHFKNMQTYNRMAAVGVLVGTEARVESYLTGALFLRGEPDIVYRPSANDLNKLVEALSTLGEILFLGGAKAIFASTRHYHRYDSSRAVYRPDDVTRFKDDLRKLVHDERDILLGTGHPQGGNRISKTPGRDGISGGVVDPQFRVHGYKNLYVCDASVFPGATTVNPQLTVMTMAHYAAEVMG